MCYSMGVHAARNGEIKMVIILSQDKSGWSWEFELESISLKELYAVLFVALLNETVNVEVSTAQSDLQRVYKVWMGGKKENSMRVLAKNESLDVWRSCERAIGDAELNSEDRNEDGGDNVPF